MADKAGMAGQVKMQSRFWQPLDGPESKLQVAVAPVAAAVLWVHVSTWCKLNWIELKLHEYGDGGHRISARDWRATQGPVRAWSSDRHACGPEGRAKKKRKPQLALSVLLVGSGSVNALLTSSSVRI